MGAGVLPTTIYKGKLYFLFGRENKFCDTPFKYSDFGGGTDNNETFLETAIREGTEESTGFLGNMQDLKKMLKKGTYIIDNEKYRSFLFYMDYDPMLPFYYNNNQRFLQSKLDPELIKTSKIFEKDEIKWICVDDLMKMKNKFRSFTIASIEKIYKERKEILSTFCKHASKKSGSNSQKTRKNRN